MRFFTHVTKLLAKSTTEMKLILNLLKLQQKKYKLPDRSVSKESNIIREFSVHMYKMLSCLVRILLTTYLHSKIVSIFAEKV